MTDESLLDNDLLISLVQQSPVLWDKTMELYKNRIATKAAWKEVIMILNPDIEAREENGRNSYAKLVIQRWTHIRDNYHRSYKKIQDQKRSGMDVKSAKPYVYSKQLRFLQKIFQPIETVSNVVTENYTESESHENNSKVFDASEINSIEIDITDTMTENSTHKRTYKRPMKMDVEDDHLDAKLVRFMDFYLNNEPTLPSNRHLSFFNGILPTLNKFDDDEVLEFQMGVLQLMKNIRSSCQNCELQSLGVKREYNPLQSPSSDDSS